jgi:type VI protein secretion system component VasK
MPDLQTFIAILTALLVFLTGVFLNYDTIQLRNYQLIIPQWTGLLLAGITFSLVAVDQLLRGLIRLEEIQRRDEEIQRRAEEEQRRAEEEQRRINQRNRSIEATERETRRTRIETRYRIAVIRFQLNPNNLYRRQLADILALLEEYQETL